MLGPVEVLGETLVTRLPRAPPSTAAIAEGAAPRRASKGGGLSLEVAESGPAGRAGPAQADAASLPAIA